MSPRGVPCGRYDRWRSELVDGSIDPGARDELEDHLVRCAGCRHDVAELRRVRQLLSGQADPAADVSTRLQARLVSIAAETDPGGRIGRDWETPFRAGAFGVVRLPSRRRRRRRLLLAAGVLGSLLVAGTGVGYLAGPPALAAVGDPAADARTGLAEVRPSVPLSGDAVTAVLGAGDRLGTAGGSTPAAGADGDALDPATPAGRSLDAAQARAALRGAQAAAGRVGYSGVERVLTAGTNGMLQATVSIDTMPSRGSALTVNDTDGTMIDEGMVPSTPAGGDLVTMLAGYRLSGVAGADLLGRQVMVVEARMPGTAATDPPRARWWIDQSTGLLLGRQTFDAAGAPLQSTMVTDLAVAGDPFITEAASRVPTLAAARLDVRTGSTLDSHGWPCEQRLAGLPLTQLRTDDAAHPGVLQLVYTDGVSTLSVLERRGRLAAAPAGSVEDRNLRAYLSSGVPRVASWQTADTVISVSTDGSSRLLAEAVHSLPHRRAIGATTMGRAEAGWTRIRQWVFG